jgi:hypothetical protein
VQRRLEVREDPWEGFFVAGASAHVVTTMAQARALVGRGMGVRAVAPTLQVCHLVTFSMAI